MIRLVAVWKLISLVLKLYLFWQVIPTDKAPSSLYYVASQDQVWIVCDSNKGSTGSRVAMVIRAASDGSASHHAVHTEPVGGHFDVVSSFNL